MYPRDTDVPTLYLCQKGGQVSATAYIFILRQTAVAGIKGE